MVDNLIKRAKAFIGLEEEGGQRESPMRQLEFVPVSKRDKDKKQAALSEGEYEIVIYEPKVYEDSLSISQQLRVGNPVLINLKNLEATEGTRLIDFVCGTAYAIDGHMIKIAESIFLFTPKFIHISDIEGKASFVQQVAEDDEEEEPSGEKFFSRR